MRSIQFLDSLKFKLRLIHHPKPSIHLAQQEMHVRHIRFQGHRRLEFLLRLRKLIQNGVRSSQFLVYQRNLRERRNCLLQIRQGPFRLILIHIEPCQGRKRLRRLDALHLPRDGVFISLNGLFLLLEALVR
jgi:hypothetical protein